MKTLNIFGAINTDGHDENYVQVFISKLKPNEEFEVVINSPGGNVFIGIAIYNLLKPFNPVIKVIGQASSIASVIAMAGRIEIAETAFMLIHNPWVMTMGDANYHKKVTERLETIKASIIKAYKDKTGKTEKELSDIMNEETFYNAEDSVLNKFADKVFKPSAEETKALGLYEIAALNNSYKVESNISQNNKEINMPNFEVDNANLKNEVKALTDEKDKLTNDYEALELKVSESTEAMEVLHKSHVELKKNYDESENKLKTATEAIAEHDKKNLENDVDNFLAKNSGKIKPAELEDLKTELLIYKNDLNMKVGDLSLFDKKCKDIEARENLNLENDVATNATTGEKEKPTETDLDFNSENKADADKVDNAIKDYAQKNKVTYEEAFETLKLENE